MPHHHLSCGSPCHQFSRHYFLHYSFENLNGKNCWELLASMWVWPSYRSVYPPVIPRLLFDDDFFTALFSLVCGLVWDYARLCLFRCAELCHIRPKLSSHHLSPRHYQPWKNIHFTTLLSSEYLEKHMINVPAHGLSFLNNACSGGPRLEAQLWTLTGFSACRKDVQRTGKWLGNESFFSELLLPCFEYQC